MENEVQETENQVKGYDKNCLGAVADVTSEDIEPGRIVVMQANSDAVKKDQAQQGAFVDIDDFETVLGYKNERPLEIIVVKMYKYWLEQYAGGDRDFIAKYPCTPENIHQDWSTTDEAGREIKRVFHHAFLVLLPQEIKEGTEMPYEFAFRSTNAKNAKKLSKMLMGLGRQNRPSWDLVFNLTAELKEKGSDSWYVTPVKQGRITSQDEKAAAYLWYKQLENTDMASIVSEKDLTATETEDVSDGEAY